MEDKLLVVTKLKKVIIYMENILDNYPKTEYILKNNILDQLYNCLELIYLGNELKDIIYIKKVIVNIKMINFYIKKSLDKKLISYKKYENIGKYLFEITNMIYGLKGYYEKI